MTVRRPKDERRGDAGVTLVELTVTMLVSSLVMVTFLTALTSAMNTSGRL